jgi:hypothetical protein
MAALTRKLVDGYGGMVAAKRTLTESLAAKRSLSAPPISPYPGPS